MIVDHLRTAEVIGFDGLIVSWWGQERREDRIAQAIYAIAAILGTILRLTLYYERVPGDDPANAVSDLAYLAERFFSSPVHLRVDGRPVLFLYGRTIYPYLWCLNERCTGAEVIDWSALLPELEARLGLLYLSADLMSPTLGRIATRIAAMGFASVHAYNLALQYASGVLAEELFDRMAGIARDNGVELGLPVIPGYDDLVLERPLSFRLERGPDGAFYRANWAAAAARHPEWLLITSFNEWHEGTEIEASVEYGVRYERLTRELVATTRNAAQR